MKHWVWEYKENPFGKDVWIAEHGGQIVACHAHVLVNIKVREKTWKSCIGADSMTHPNFRRRGLQRKMEDVSHDELVKAGIYFAYYFPGEVFHRHQRRGKNYDVCKMPIMIKVFNTDRILMELFRSRLLARVLSVWLNPVIGVFFRSKKKPVIEKVKTTRIVQFDDRINDLWKNVSRYFDIIVVRNKEYLNWRYFQRPNSNFKVLLAKEEGKILGYIVFSFRDEKGFIVDLLVCPHRLDVIQSLVLMAMEQLQKEKVHWILCWMLKNNPYYEVLRVNGFIPHLSKYPCGQNKTGSSSPLYPNICLYNRMRWHGG
jgi:hypothetical protein